MNSTIAGTTAALALILITGCATNQGAATTSGAETHIIDCGDNEVAQSRCERRADALCPGGYRIVEQLDEYGGPDPNRATGVAAVSPNLNRRRVISCTVQQAEAEQSQPPVAADTEAATPPVEQEVALVETETPAPEAEPQIETAPPQAKAAESEIDHYAAVDDFATCMAFYDTVSNAETTTDEAHRSSSWHEQATGARKTAEIFADSGGLERDLIDTIYAANRTIFGEEMRVRPDRSGPRMTAAAKRCQQLRGFQDTILKQFGRQ